MAGTPPRGGKRKVPAGPKAQPTVKGKGAASSRKAQSPTGIDPSSPFYGIKSGRTKSKTPAGLKPNRDTPDGQSRLSNKAKRQVG
jgi:hypothetical protein